MSDRVRQVGGVRVGLFNATFPLVTLTADNQTLRLSCPGGDYVFPRSSITKLSRHRGLFSVGLRIEHTVETYPQLVVFWASIFPWTPGFQLLRGKLESLGYAVAA
jgi:hypothetical protein